MGTPLGPKYIPYTYMDPLGSFNTSRSELLLGGSAALNTKIDESSHPYKRLSYTIQCIN